MRALSLALLFISLVMPAFAAEKTATPEALVAELYQSQKAGGDPFAVAQGRKLADRFLTKALADMIVKDVKRAGDQIPTIDFDPLHDTQDDLEIKNFVIGKGAVKGTSATVKVSFDNAGQKVVITFKCEQENGTWKVADISYRGGENSLVKMLKDAGN